MFPDITRDDVFRIETPRLWLRWPERRDCAAIRAYASCFAVADMTSSVPHPYPEGEAERFVAHVRASNSVGKTLELVIEHKSTRKVIGTVLVRFGQDQRLTSVMRCILIIGGRAMRARPPRLWSRPCFC